MYGLTTLIEFPNSDDPKLEGMELFDSAEAAVSKANKLLKVFIDEYGEDITQRATTKNLFAMGFNGEVTWRAYISEIKA